MSLNDYFAANGAVYLRPVGLPDCFTLPGMPHGCKPPPLTMQHPCGTPPKPRTMAAVSPLHQVVPPQPSIPSYDSGNIAFSTASRTSSFAAALRKLAKQAVDPVSGEKDLSPISPVSSPVLNQGSLTPKRNVQNPSSSAMFISNHQMSYASSSPPVVTIAPSRPVATHTSDSRKVMDLSNVTQTTSGSNLSNGHMPEQMGVKLDSKVVPRPAHADKWDEPNKGLSTSSASSQVRPHATIAPLPRPDDSLTSSRGFQPYRGTEESRNTLPHHLSLFEHPAASYPYTPAFLPPPHLSHPAYRFEDPLYLERYSLLRPPVMPYPQPGMMAPPAAFYPNSRYAADLIAQSLSLNSANNSILNHERLKQEEERRMREKELELDQSRSKEQERLRDKEQKEKEREQREKDKREREKSYREKEEKFDYAEHKKSLSNSNHVSSSKRTESPSVRSGSSVHCSSANLTTSTATSVGCSIPLNLVVSPETPKKETELWMPWQQPAINHYAKDNQDVENNMKHPAFRSQDNQRLHHTKDTHTNERVNLRFSPSILNEKKPSEGETRKQTEGKRFESQHHPVAEMSGREPEWRHEKLQKACTNNHRRSHESKKAKEGGTQRKTPNGTILKASPYQNEGMHARLLESEKCRLEMNGQVGQPLCSERLPVPTYKSNYLVVPQKSFVDCYGAPPPKTSVDLTPVVSKLDLEAKNLLKNDFNWDDDEAKDELRLKNFLIITKGPQLKLDTNPLKIKFLKLFGLTTHFKRKKIEFDMYLKRRKILLEDSEIPPLSPAPAEEETRPPSPLPQTNANMKRLAEQLNSETTPGKLEFFLKIGLTPITLVKKEEKERIRRIVEEERVRRHHRMLAKANKRASPRRLFVPKSEAAQRLDHLRKMKERNAVTNGWLSKRSADEPSDLNLSSSNRPFDSKTEQAVLSVPYLVSPEAANPCSVSQSSPSPGHKSFAKFSFKRGHSLKNEWRFHNTESTARGNPADNIGSNCISVSTQVDSGLLGSEVSAFNWPGLDAIMEAFYRHQKEQTTEKKILSGRCHFLRQTQEELKKEADSLSKQMSENLRYKRELDEAWQKHQQAVDRLKQCLQLAR